jgi:hypothetical protein
VDGDLGLGVYVGLQSRSRLQQMIMLRQRVMTLRMLLPMTAARKRGWWSCSVTRMLRSWRQTTRWRLPLLLPTAQGEDRACSSVPSSIGGTHMLGIACNCTSNNSMCGSLCQRNIFGAMRRSASAHRESGTTPRLGSARRECSLLPGRPGGAALLTEEELLSQRCRALGQLYRLYKVSADLSAYLLTGCMCTLSQYSGGKLASDILMTPHQFVWANSTGILGSRRRMVDCQCSSGYA